MIYVQHGQDTDRGSFAVVIPALEVDDETGACRQVAVKRVRARHEFPSGKNYDDLHDQATKLFERERRIWCSLSPHPGLVPALRATRIDGEPVLLLEYIYGATLDEILAKPNGPLHPVDFLDLCDQLSSALRHLHEICRVAHGDVSPQNIFYDGTGRTQLADFSLAASIGERYATSSNLSLTLRAPEQEDALHVTPAVDTWKVAVCLLLAARGESLSVATTGTQDFCGPRSHKTDVTSSVERLIRSIDDETFKSSVRRFLLRATAPDPEKRFQDGGELADAVRALRSTNPRWSDSLEERQKIRRRLLFWSRTSPRSQDEAFNELKGIRADLLSGTYVSAAHRLLPETYYLLARAAALSLEGYKRNLDLLEFARSMAQTSVDIFDGDPRPLEIMIQVGKVLREVNGGRGIDMRSERDFVRLFKKFRTFLRAHQVRELEGDLIQLEALGNNDAKMLLQEVHVELAEFDRRLLLHYKNLEGRLIDRR